jgi:hypothetical protein
MERDLMAQGESKEEAHQAAEEEYPADISGESGASSGSTAAPSGSGLRLSTIFFIAVGVLGGIFGTAYFPMALLITAVFNTSAQAFNYPFGIGTAQRIWSDYILCTGIYFGGAVAITVSTYGVGYICGLIPLIGAPVGSLIGSALALYQLLALSYLVGRLYYCNEQKIGWF